MASLAAQRRAVAIWLFACCGLVFLMIVVGGITRLTHSGLSIVEWQPVVGAIPPLNDTQWQESFAKYRETPEFKQRNFDMTVEGYKRIFWWEYAHRLLGRVVGLAFLVPFVFFLAKKMIPPELVRELVGIFLLGGMQGLLGWWMVQSGLVGDPRVSSLRLAAHLGVAVLIYGAMFWIALGLIYRKFTPSSYEMQRRVSFLIVLVFVMIVSGALVAGIRAGFAYNTWPLMGGRWIPEDIMILQPWWRNLYSNMATVQFIHRLLAIVVVAYVLLTWFGMRQEPPNPRARFWSHILVGVVAIQFLLGVTTLVLQVPINLAVLHQTGAVALFSCAIVMRHALRPVPQLQL